MGDLSGRNLVANSGTDLTAPICLCPNILCARSGGSPLDSNEANHPDSRCIGDANYSPIERHCENTLLSVRGRKLETDVV